jgi:hypothetical protein
MKENQIRLSVNFIKGEKIGNCLYKRIIEVWCWFYANDENAKKLACLAGFYGQDMKVVARREEKLGNLDFYVTTVESVIDSGD